MLSILSIAALLIATVQAADFSSSCPIDSPISCSSNGDTSNSCCYENPGGIILFTQFWDYNPASGPADSFTIHSIWNDYCSGGYPQFCDTSLEIDSTGSTIESIVVDQFGDQTLYDNMNKYWTDINGNNKKFWAHKFNKHGTCLNTLNPSCYSNYKQNENVYDYYSLVYQLFQKLPTYQWLVSAGIKPSTTATYTLSQIQSALKSKFGAEVYIACDSNNAINEVWYFYNIKGSILQQNYLPIDTVSKTNCPSSGIKFPPKGNSGANTLTTKTTGTTTSGSGSTSVPATSYINLTGKSGCLISNGKYYTSGTCATYHFNTGSSGNTQITSSKGNCGIDSSNQFTCSSSTSATDFQVSGGSIGYNGNFDWCLGAVTGSGSTAQTSVKLSDGSCSSFKLTLSS